MFKKAPHGGLLEHTPPQPPPPPAPISARFDVTRRVIPFTC
eukprot:gene26671-biopygen17119